MLASWAADRRAVHGRRVQVVRTAAEAGLIKSEIHRLAGLARRTLDRIPGRGEAASRDRRACAGFRRASPGLTSRPVSGKVPGQSGGSGI